MIGAVVFNKSLSTGIADLCFILLLHFLFSYCIV